MSDPMTNLEIEDVLSSIRRLVSDGDKARTRDSAHETDAQANGYDAVESHRQDSAHSGQPDGDDAQRHDTAKDTGPDASQNADIGQNANTDTQNSANPSAKFVLTPAFLVAGGTDMQPQHEQDENRHQADDHTDSDASLDDEPETVDDTAQHKEAQSFYDHQAEAKSDERDDTTAQSAQHDDHHTDDDYSEGDHLPADAQAEPVADDFDPNQRFADSVELAKMDTPSALEPSDPAVDDDSTGTASSSEDDATADRSELIATIAELEAAISADGADYEPDGSGDGDDVAAGAVPWLGRKRAEGLIEANTAKSDTDQATTDGSRTPHDWTKAANVVQSDDQTATSHSTSDTAQPNQDIPDDDIDDDLDGLLSAGSVAIDEDALREMVAQVVREELTGPLGERITRNVRKLVRREIYRVLSSQEFD